MSLLRGRRWRALLVNLAVLAGGVLVAALVLEVALRLLGMSAESRNIQFIPGKGITYLPGAPYRHTKEGFSEGRFNSHGFRDRERTWEKPPETTRIVVLGDSYVEALQVPLEQSYCARLEAELNAGASAGAVEVIALGQSGFGTADAYKRFLDFGVRYDPDLVILGFLSGNDFRNNSRHLNRATLNYYFLPDGEDGLILDTSEFDRYEASYTTARRAFQTAKRWSYLLALVSERGLLLRRDIQEDRLPAPWRAASKESLPRPLDPFSDLNIYLDDAGDRWREAVEITEKAIVVLRDAVERTGARFLLVSLSNAEQVHPSVQRQHVATFGLPFEWERPEHLLAGAAARHGVGYLALMPILRDHHARTGELVHGFGGSDGGHWNEAGHRVAAEATARYLEAHDIVRGPAL